MFRRLKYSAILTILISFQGMAQRIGYDWINTFANVDAVVSAIDKDQNILIAGSYTGTLTFGDKSVTSVGNNTSIFLAKFDTDGNVAWIISDTLQKAEDIAVDENDNIYLTATIKHYSLQGESFKAVSFIYVAKFDKSGNRKWINTSDVQILNNPDGNLATSIACDSYGSIYITGYYISSLSFGSQKLENGSIFVAKFDSTGSPVWLKNISGNNTFIGDYKGVGYDILVDRNDQLFITGYFRISHANYIFLIRLNTNGDQQYLTRIIGSNYSRGERLHTDKEGNLFLAAMFDGLITVNDKNYNTLVEENNPIIFKFLNDSIVSVTHIGFNVSQSIIDRDFSIDDSLNLFYTASVSENYIYSPMIFKIDPLGNIEQQYEIAQGNLNYFSILSSIIHDSSGNLFLSGLLRQMAYFGDSLVGYPNDSWSAFLGKINLDEAYNGIPNIEKGNGVVIIYPSLTHENICIESYSENLHNKGVTIYNSAGEIVQRTLLLSNKTRMNLSGLGRGIYFVEISGKDFRETHKIVKY